MFEKEDISLLKARIEDLEEENTRLSLANEDIKDAMETRCEGLEQERVQLRMSMVSTVQSLARAIEFKDPYTFGHSELVCKYAMAVADQLEWEWERIERVQMAGMLLDVGNIGVPAKILGRPGPLTMPEIKIMRKHVEIGGKILESVMYPKDLAAIVMQHHERWDGSGYPRGLTGESILPEARVLGLVDSFVSMTADRSWRKAISRASVLEHIKSGAGTLFDPKMAHAFLEVLERGEDAIFKDVESFAGRAVREGEMEPDWYYWNQ